MRIIAQSSRWFIFSEDLQTLTIWWQNHPMMYDHTNNDKQTTTGRRELNQIDNEVEPNIEEKSVLTTIATFILT
jgi:hypothetical protein